MNTTTLADDNAPECTLCQRPRNADGTDPCIGMLPGVSYACCGHGQTTGYILFENGVRVTLARKGKIEQCIRPKGYTRTAWLTNVPPEGIQPIFAMLDLTM